MTARIEQFLRETDPPTPCVVVDLNVVESNFSSLRSEFPTADIYYAVKANPAKEIVEQLVSLNSSFDTASIPEIELCLSLGAKPEQLSFGNTIKKERDIKTAFDLGINLFAFDSELELEKIARQAPGSKVFCRILTDGEGAEWPLSRKFGCYSIMAVQLLRRAKELGLHPYGVSFHVGSQQTNLSAWRKAINITHDVFKSLAHQGIELQMVNLGGGFPAHYTKNIAALSEYSAAIHGYMHEFFGDNLPRMILEPGRSMVGDSGVLVSEVVLISHKSYADDDVRWVYLDVGKFGGLAETMDEAIRYRITTDRDDANTLPSILAGPTCDSADIMYEKNPYPLAADLQVGDKVYIQSAGAYTTSYSSVFFNGFAPLKNFFVK